MSRSVALWVGKTDDTAAPQRVRLRVWERCQGRCGRCDRLIRAGEKWTLEHVIALINGGANAEDNMDLTCSNCLPRKNAADVAEKKIINRKRSKHLGLHKTKTPFPKPPPGFKHQWGKPWPSRTKRAET